jgi:hypothetical protein
MGRKDFGIASLHDGYRSIMLPFDVIKECCKV